MPKLQINNNIRPARQYIPVSAGVGSIIYKHTHTYV